MGSTYTKTFNNTSSGNFIKEYSSDQIANWKKNGTQMGKSWKQIQNLILGLVHTGVPTLSELADLYQEEKALKVKAMDLNDTAFATRVIHSMMRNNDPVVKELIPEDTLKAIAKDLKSNS
tara:strand:- start:3060 stop:3419 length:360 start_codon:yes stop_codon:yes gene_type:complete